MNKHLNMTQKWSELQIKEIYTVTNTRIVDTKNENGKYIIFTLLNNGDVWVPEHLKIESITVITFTT